MAHDGLCGRCGAPFPRSQRGELVTCAYCGLTPDAPGGAPSLSPVQLAERRMRVIEAFRSTLQNRGDPEQAVATAAREHLGPLGETDVLARVVMALARAFERDTGASITADPMAMGRVLEGYLKAIEDMRATGYAELELPFLTATAKGPQHLKRRLDPGTLRALLDAPKAPAKKGWWPF